MKPRLYILLFVMVLIVACSTGKPTPPPVPTAIPTTPVPPTAALVEIIPPTPAPTETLPVPVDALTLTLSADQAPVQQAIVYGPADFPTGIDPLTGKPAADAILLERRPVAVKIQMFPRGQRPPWGISQADIVYDYYQNFGLTRLHAIFYGQNAETVGPIRSARLLDIDLVSMYNSVFAFGSAEQRTYSRLFSKDFSSRLVVEGGASCPPMCRVEPDSYNYLVANTAELSKYISGKGVDNARPVLDGMSFASALPPGGQPLQQISVRYSISSYARWDYDPAIGRYLRSQDVQEAFDSASEVFEPLVDRANNQQIAADNIVVLFAAHQFTFNTHPGPNEVVEIQLTGTGDGYAFRDGQVYQVVWNRTGPNTPVFLSLPDGTRYAFKPGVTWFQVVGRTTKIENSVAGVIRFVNGIP